MGELIEANRRRSALITLAFVAVVVVFGVLVGALLGRPVVGAVAGLVIGIAAAVAAHRLGTRIVVAGAGARAVGPDEQPRLHNLIDGLCATAGVSKPEVYVIDDRAPNAFVVGRGTRETALVATTGLVTLLDRIELEAVVAHLLSRIRSREASTSTVAATLIGWPVLLAELALRRRGTAWIGYALLTTAPVVAPIMRLAAPPDRTVVADLGACQLTRYPPGLLAALADLAATTTVTSAALSATAHLWLVQPISEVDDDGPLRSIHRRFDNHPPLDERIALVREL